MKFTKPLKAFAVIASTLVIGFTQLANASLITFTDRAEWEAAVSGVSVESFDAISPFSFASNTTANVGLLDIETIVPASGGFSRVESGANNPFGTNINGTNYLAFGLRGSTQRQINLSFGAPVVAWATDWSLGSLTDLIQVNFAGESVTFGTRGESGFIGFLSDISFSQVNVRDPAISTTFGGFDNISFATSPATQVPEPATLSLLGFLLLAIRFGRSKRA